MHFHILIIIPKDVYLKGNMAIYGYIGKQLFPYNSFIRLAPYITKYKDEVNRDYEEFIKNGRGEVYDITSLPQYIAYMGYTLNGDGHVTSTKNCQGFYDFYEIGGQWNGELSGRAYMYDRILNNSLSIDKLLDKYIKTGQVYELFLNGIKNVEQDLYYTILNEYIEDYVVSIDYHYLKICH